MKAGRVFHACSLDGDVSAVQLRRIVGTFC